jgi:hypothetical protein
MTAREIVIRVEYLNSESEHAAVRELGEHIGWGNVMHRAEQCWREHLVAHGGPAGGEHTCGPCSALLVPCPCVQTRGDGPACDWCCGAGRLTKRVYEARLAAEGTPRG